MPPKSRKSGPFTAGVITHAQAAAAKKTKGKSSKDKHQSPQNTYFQELERMVATGGRESRQFPDNFIYIFVSGLQSLAQKDNATLVDDVATLFVSSCYTRDASGILRKLLSEKFCVGDGQGMNVLDFSVNQWRYFLSMIFTFQGGEHFFEMLTEHADKILACENFAECLTSSEFVVHAAEYEGMTPLEFIARKFQKFPELLISNFGVLSEPLKTLISLSQPKGDELNDQDMLDKDFWVWALDCAIVNNALPAFMGVLAKALSLSPELLDHLEPIECTEFVIVFDNHPANDALRARGFSPGNFVSFWSCLALDVSAFKVFFASCGLEVKLKILEEMLTKDCDYALICDILFSELFVGDENTTSNAFETFFQFLEGFKKDSPIPNPLLKEIYLSLNEHCDFILQKTMEYYTLPTSAGLNEFSNTLIPENISLLYTMLSLRNLELNTDLVGHLQIGDASRYMELLVNIYGSTPREQRPAGITILAEHLLGKIRADDIKAPPFNSTQWDSDSEDDELPQSPLPAYHGVSSSTLFGNGGEAQNLAMDVDEEIGAQPAYS